MMKAKGSASKLRLVLFLTILVGIIQQDASLPPVLALPGPFGVCIGWGLGTKEQLDILGDVWYIDYGYRGEELRGHPRLYMVRARVPLDRGFEKVMRANPGSWWILGNEPNDPNQDNISPAEYAKLYHDFYHLAKRTDAFCRILPAGIADADWRWAEAFREKYREAYGCYPPVDGWNIHNYLLDPDLDPYDVKEFKRRIVAFGDWMGRIGERDKPLFLTEFGVLYGAGCCGRPIDPPGKVVSFMRETVSWLEGTDYVQYWAWFAINSGGRFNGDLFDAEGKLTLFGAAYRDLMRGTGD